MLDYVLRYESNQYKQVGRSYRSKEHKSLAVSDKGFYWHSTGENGRTALDYLMAIRNYDFVSAVCHLINEAPYEKGDSANRKKQGRSPPVSKQTISQTSPSQLTPPLSQTSHESLSSAQSPPATSKQAIQQSELQLKPQAEPQNIILPRRNKDNYQVIAYLQNRGIDRDVIMDCINRGVLYESALRKNAVFLGKDENGKTRFAAMRGTRGSFKCDAEGSDKSYGFVIPPKNDSRNNSNVNNPNANNPNSNNHSNNNPNSQTVMLFESPIDCLSHQTLCKRGDMPDFNGWRLSLGGTADVALIGFLERHPNINHCIVATDNDEAGNAFAERIASKVEIPVERVHPLQGKDWNDALLLALQALTPLQKGEHANEHASPDTSLY